MLQIINSNGMRCKKCYQDKNQRERYNSMGLVEPIVNKTAGYKIVGFECLDCKDIVLLNKGA